MEQSDPKILDRLKKLPPFDETQEEPVVEQPQNETEAVVDSQEEPQAQETEQNEVEETVETNNDRTKQQFDKLKDSNKSLKEENEFLKKNVLESLRPEPVAPVQYIPQQPQYFTQPQPQYYQPQQVQQPVDPFADLVDQDEYVNTQRLKEMAKMAYEAKERAERAEKLAQQLEIKRQQDKRDFEESQEIRRTHQDFPELNPNSDVFDQTLFDAVKNELISQYTNGQSDVYAATKKWHSILIKPMNKQEAQKKAEQKSQIVATTASKTQTPDKGLDLDALRKGTMYKTKGALAERLRRSGY